MSWFGKQIAAAELGLSEPVIRVGNLESVRTFCDVRDAVRAYWLLVNKCEPGEVYNIGGLETMTVGQALDLMIDQAKTKVEVVQDAALLRPSDVTLQVPSAEKFKKATGWKPEIPVKKTFADILEYWRHELKINPWKLETVVK